MATEKLRLYNTTTQEKEVFKPIDKKMAGMYVCVSDARTAVAFDVLRRYLRHLGYEVNYASNLTHFSDKLINQATKCDEKKPSDFTSHFFEDCLSDMSTLHCPLLPTNQQPNCEHMVNIIEMIKKIIEKDSGYVVEGDVFFSVNKSPNYGQLSRQQLDHTDAGSECLVVDPKKRNSADFALWKATKPGELNWESPWGLGRPGWHIGCSAMSTLYLSPRFDILGGGAYLKFPHHEHVIAQTCAAYEDSGVTYRLHTAHVTNNNVEMENSLQNSVTIREITSKYHPLALRHFLMSAHYRYPLKYSVLQLESSSDTLVSVYQTLQDLTEALPPLLAAMAEEGEVYNQDEKVTNRIHKLKNHVEKNISDDLYTVNILKGALDNMMRFIRRVINEHRTWNRNRLMPMVLSLIEVERAVREVLDVLGLLTTQIYSDILKDMKQMALARVQIGAEEILQDKIDLEFCNGTVKKRLSPVQSLVPVELMQFVTPADNVVYYVRKSCHSESEAINEYEVLSILRGSVGVVQSVGNSIHECETFYAYFMEYAPAGTLYDEIRRHSNGLPIDIVRRYTQMILEGLQSLYDAGFVHGDLHSMNVLLFPSEGGLVAKITDFGRTKRIGDSSWWSFQKPFLGFQTIMSPESESEGTTNEGHDVWAMGLLVKAMFADAKAQKTMFHSEEEVGDLMNIVVSDPEASDFTSLCLVVDPERRAKVNDLLQHRFMQIN